MDAFLLLVMQLALQIGLLLLLAPLVQGYIKKLKALLQGRQGPPLLQPYHDLFKLLGKEAVIPRTASWLFRVAPYASCLAVLAGSVLIPVAFAGSPLALLGDLLAVTFLFALARFLTALAAMDTGSAFAGMGASREVTVASLVEPALLLALFTLALPAQSTHLGEIMAAQAQADPGVVLTPGHYLALASFFIVLIAETGRIPVDNPDTHLELTMIHEGMALEMAGRHLALVNLSHMVKQFALLALAGNLFFPWGIATAWSAASLLAGALLTLAKVLVLATALALVETTMPKLRLFRVPDLLGASFALSLLALVAGQLSR